MPKVRLLADAAGRYETSKGELFVCTDEEFSRWEPAGVVELAGKAAEVEVEVEPGFAEDQAVEAPKPKARTRKTSG